MILDWSKLAWVSSVLLYLSNAFSASVEMVIHRVFLFLFVHMVHHLSFNCAVPVVHANRRAMNPHAGSSKWHNSHLIDRNTHTHFNMTGIVETPHRADSTGFISLVDVGTFYQGELQLADVGGRAGGKGTLLPFLSVPPIFSISCLMQESNGTKNEQDGVSWLVVCHRMPLPFLLHLKKVLV